METNKQSKQNIEKLEKLSSKIIKYTNIDSITKQTQQENQKTACFHEKINKIQSNFNGYLHETSNQFVELKERLDFLFVSFNKIKKDSQIKMKAKDLYINQLEGSISSYIDKFFNKNNDKTSKIKEIIDKKQDFLLNQIKNEKENVNFRLETLKKQVDLLKNQTFSEAVLLKKERCEASFHVTDKLNEMKSEVSVDLKENNSERLLFNDENIRKINQFQYEVKKEIRFLREERENKERNIINIINKLNKDIEN